jgi:DNA-binding HxlR family transcriptional regulator
MTAQACKPYCAEGITVKILSGKWKIRILYSLSHGTKRFNAIQRDMPEVTQRMLTMQLRELEEDGIIIRKVYAEVPPKVEYSLSDIGEKLKPILEHLRTWGACYLAKRKKVAK